MTDHWQHQLALAQASRQAQALGPHNYAKAYAKTLKSKKDGLPTLVDLTTELLQQQHDNMVASHGTSTSNRGLGRSGEDKLSAQLDDEKLLKEQEGYYRMKHLEMEARDQHWLSVDMLCQGVVNLLMRMFTGYEFLTKVFLAGNNLTQIPKEILRLRFLRVLDLSGNRLTLLPVEMDQLFNLKYLYLFDNRIQDLPYEFGNLSELVFLGIEGNPFNKEHAKIIAEKGSNAFIHYLRDNRPIREIEDLHSLREWYTVDGDGEFQKGTKPEHAKGLFTVLSYNILCHHYATSKLYGYTPSWALKWEYRFKRIMKEVVSLDCDLVCLQEVESQAYEDTWVDLMLKHGYKGVFYNKGRARRSGFDSKKVDGCAFFYKTLKFRLVDKVFVEYSLVFLANERFQKTDDVFNRFTNKDHIAVISYLEHLETKKRLILVNTHLHWDPAFNDVKTLQVAVLLEELQTLCKKYARSGLKDLLAIPIIICGDFNSQIHSAVYKLLENGLCVDHPDFKGVNYGKYTEEGFSHQFQFKSAYSHIGELGFTNFTPTFTEVIDYIWYNTQSIEVRGMLGGILEDYTKNLVGFPDENHPSDHIALMCEMRFKNVEEKRSRKT